MGCGFRNILIGFYFLGLVAPSAGITLTAGNEPSFTFAHEQAFRRGLKTNDLIFLPPLGPFTFGLLSNILGPESPLVENFLGGLDTGKVQLFTIATERYRAERNAEGENLPRLTAGFIHRPASWLAAEAAFTLDRARAIDPTYPGKKYRGLAGNMETAVLMAAKGSFSVVLGRTRVSWGPKRTNLILSETAEPLDLLAAGYARGRVAFSFLFARLDESRPLRADSLRFPGRSFADNRYLAAHRLDLRLHRRLRLGLTEAIVFGGEGRPPELYYMNPLLPYHAAQLNENEDDNSLFALDGAFFIDSEAMMYAQILVDDIQIDNHSSGDREPDEIGLLVGLYRAGKDRGWMPDINLEYTGITNRTYHQREPRNRYLLRNRLLGHPLGPDADSLSLRLRWWPETDFYIEIEGAYCRHGAGSVFDPWGEPWLEYAGDYAEPFPTGIVEKAALVTIRAAGYIPFSDYTRRHLFIFLDAGWGEKINFNNLNNNRRTAGRIDCNLSWIGLTSIAL